MQDFGKMLLGLGLLLALSGALVLVGSRKGPPAGGIVAFEPRFLQ